MAVAVAPRPAPHHTGPTCRRSLRVGCGRRTVVAAVIPVVHPLKHIPCHVHHTVRAGAAGIGAHTARVTNTVAGPTVIVKICFRAVRHLVPPRVLARAAAPSRRLLPLRLRRQALARPRTEGSGLAPVHLDHRIVRISARAVVGEACVGIHVYWRRASPRIHTRLVAGVGHLVLVDVVAVQRHRVQRLIPALARLCRIAAVAPHLEAAGGDQDLFGGVKNRRWRRCGRGCRWCAGRRRRWRRRWRRGRRRSWA